MKATLGALICLLTLVSCSSEPEEVIVPERTVVYHEDRLVIDGKELAFPLEKDAIVGMLGEPSQQFDLISTILVWHHEGIFTYQDKGKSVVSSVAFELKPQYIDYSPKSQFAGSVKVGDLEIHSGTTLEELQEHGFKQAGWAADVMHLDKTKTYRVFVTYGLTSRNLFEVSIVTHGGED